MSLEHTEQTAEEIDGQTVSLQTDTPYYTFILVGSIVVVAILQFTTNLDASITTAGFDKPAFLSRHEYWRILTGSAVHASAMHILMNSYALYSFGRVFEMLSNRAHLAIVFLLSDLCGGVLSLIMMPDGISVGASGGIVGLIGYLAVYSFKRREFISAAFRKNLLINIGIIIVFGLALSQTIDNAAHAGGLVAGAFYALIQVPADGHTDPRRATSFVEVAGLAALGVFLATCAVTALMLARVI